MTSSRAETRRLFDEADLIVAARRVATRAKVQAATLDRDGAFPADGIRALHAEGLLLAPMTACQREVAPASCDLLRGVLVTLGEGSLSLGRLYEGHVNAVALVARYGSTANIALLAGEIAAGRPSGVWMAGEPLRLVREAGRMVLRGRKILCSGAGHVQRPLVAADHEGGSLMVVPRLDGRQVDAGGWTAHGMRATATGSVDFDGVGVDDDEIIGQPGDYLRSPYFRGGAWRVIAVQLGGLEAILAQYKAQLHESAHRDHPLQLARFGEAEIACETARLWVCQAARVAEGPFEDADAVDAYVDLARNAFEAAALRVIALAQKAIGLKAFLRPNPIERIVRDLTTYLRQPALDMSLLAAAAYRLDRHQ